MPIDPTDLTKSIGAIGSLDPERGLAPTLQQVVLAADGAGLMLIDRQGQLRWASASGQTAQAVRMAGNAWPRVPVSPPSASGRRR